MNPAFLGDSYDLVKRFFCGELSALGYSVTVDPMFTGNWADGLEDRFFRLIGAVPSTHPATDPQPSALFLDPDTGVSNRPSLRHVPVSQLAARATTYALVFAFDQSFSRQYAPQSVMIQKLDALRQAGCHGMYYDSHARFLFVSRQSARVHNLRTRLLDLGLPATRLLELSPSVT